MYYVSCATYGCITYINLCVQFRNHVLFFVLLFFPFWSLGHKPYFLINLLAYSNRIYIIFQGGKSTYMRMCPYTYLASIMIQLIVCTSHAGLMACWPNIFSNICWAQKEDQNFMLQYFIFLHFSIPH